jgi:hypothetical protein
MEYSVYNIKDHWYYISTGINPSCWQHLMYKIKELRQFRITNLFNKHGKLSDVSPIPTHALHSNILTKPISLFWKIKRGLWDHLPVCVLPLISVWRLMRWLALCIPPQFLFHMQSVSYQAYAITFLSVAPPTFYFLCSPCHMKGKQMINSSQKYLLRYSTAVWYGLRNNISFIVTRCDM